MTQDDWTKKRDEAARNHNAKKQGSKIDFKAGWNACRADSAKEYVEVVNENVKLMNIHDQLLKERDDARYDNGKLRDAITEKNKEINSWKGNHDTQVARKQNLSHEHGLLHAELAALKAENEKWVREGKSWDAQRKVLHEENLRIQYEAEASNSLGDERIRKVIAERDALLADMRVAVGQVNTAISFMIDSGYADANSHEPEYQMLECLQILRSTLTAKYGMGDGV